MARTKVVLPPDSTGQAMGVSTYSNGTETVAAPETVLVSPTGTPITPTTPSDTQPVSGTFWQATQPVSGTVTVQDGGGAISIDDNGSTVSIDDGGGSVTVDGTFWQATQPVSGTVIANAGTGTMAVSLAAGATAPAKAEDTASADADVGIPAMAVRKATPANTSGTDGDYEMLQMSAGRLWTSATIDAALPAGTAAIGKLAANDGVDVGDVTINNASGASAVNVQDGGNSLTVDGTFWQATQPVSGTVTASNVTGNVAHDGVDSGNPVLQGFQAIAHGANPTAVAAADRTVGYANRAGVPFVMGGHPNVISRRDAYTAAQTDTALVTVAAGLKIVVTRVLLTCANSNSVDVSARVGFGTANTPTGAGVVASHPGIAKGGGFNTGDGSGILGVGADNEDLRLTCSVPTGGSIEVVTSYYTVES